MEPIPETRQALEHLGETGREVLDQLVERANLVREVVPSCVGVTLATRHDGLAFTVAATAPDVAAVDAVQYLSGGPCVSATEVGEVGSSDRGEPLDEASWSLYARSLGSGEIASTVTLPLLDDDEVVGTVNLYASTPGAFAGQVEQVAGLFDAWAPGAVSDADLDFATRDEARRAPQRLEDDDLVSRAIGILMVDLDLEADAAAAALAEAAHRAGVQEVEVARRVVRVSRDQDAEG